MGIKTKHQCASLPSLSNEVKHQQNKENSQIHNKLKVLCKVEFSCYKDTSSCLKSTQTIV